MTSVRKEYEDLIRSNEARSREQFLASEGLKPDEIYKDLEAKAKTDLSLSSTDRGSLASTLFSRGLSGSGYEEYIKKMTEGDYEKALGEAKESAALAEQKNAGGYEKYLTEYGKLQTKISKSFIESFAEGGDFSLERAYEGAIKAGLSDANALYSAARAVNAAKDRAVEESIAFARMNGLTPYRAKEYAKSLGLPDKECEKVYLALSGLSDEEKRFFSSLTPDEYYEFVKSRS